MFPYPDHVKAQMRKSENKRDDQQDFTFFPTNGLLMPESRDHTKDGKDDPDHIQSQLTVAVRLIVFQFAMLDSTHKYPARSASIAPAVSKCRPVGKASCTGK